MPGCKHLSIWVVIVGLWAASNLVAQDKKTDKQAPRPSQELAEYRTTATAKTTTLAKALETASQPGYLGVHAIEDSQGRVRLDAVQPNSPAAKAGLRAGDLVQAIADISLGNLSLFREILLASSPGEALSVRVIRNGKEEAVRVTLGAGTKPMKGGGPRAVLGIVAGETPDGDGVALQIVTPGLPAEKAGLKLKDILTRIDGAPLPTPSSVSDSLAGRQPGDEVIVTVRRNGKDEDIKVKLAADPNAVGPGSWDARAAVAWKKNVYRLAVVPIEFPDVKRNPKIEVEDWHEALFSSKSYTGKSVTGQRVFGSMRDYYTEQSFGKLRTEGKVFDYVEVAKKRADYGQSTNPAQKTTLLGEAMDKVLERDGKEALNGFDGVFFLYAGSRVQTNRGGLYWPHRASFTHKGKRWSYFISNEGGAAMSTISVICHEFGHMLGLPDLYARPENPGSEGVGVWCAMSNQVGNGRPQHFGAWSKERLGWVDPVVLNPTVKQKLILSPIEDSPRECFKVLVKADGSEYFLLENRRKKGFDQELPGEGLLIWRVVQNKPILEESHGVEGPLGPRVHLNAVPFPSAANDAFTPHTMPSSRSQLGGGLPVWLTNIRKLPDGRVTFWIGYEFF
jgi:M6 family metalloprotease-like protein